MKLPALNRMVVERRSEPVGTAPTNFEAEGAKTQSPASWEHMTALETKPVGPDRTRALLEQIASGDRGRQLRAKVRQANPDMDDGRIDDAFQIAYERAARSCKGQSEGEVYVWLRTTMIRELGHVRGRIEREAPVDWSAESLSRFRRCDTSVADEVAEREAEGEVLDLAASVLDELTERQRAVAVLYAHGLQRKEIADHLDITPRVVKRSLEQLLSSGRQRMIRLAGGGCPEGEPLVARYAFGLGSQRDVQRAQAHLATCPRCGALYERLDLWREQVAAAIPLPVAAGAHSQVTERVANVGGEILAGAQPPVPVETVATPRGHVAGALANLREHATGLYARTFDPTPLAGARPGAVAAAIAGCIAVGSGATYCVDQSVGVGSIGRLTGIASAEPKSEKKQRKPRAQAAQAPVTTETTSVVVAPPAVTPVPTATATPTPTETTPQPPPAPEDQFQPTSAGTTASSPSATTASAPVATPKAAPVDGAPEFGGP